MTDKVEMKLVNRPIGEPFVPDHVTRDEIIGAMEYWRGRALAAEPRVASSGAAAQPSDPTHLIIEEPYTIAQMVETLHTIASSFHDERTEDEFNLVTIAGYLESLQEVVAPQPPICTKHVRCAGNQQDCQFGAAQPTPSAEERAQFEKWALKEYYGDFLDGTPPQTLVGMYADDDVQEAWKGWQAARAPRVEPPTQQDARGIDTRSGLPFTDEPDVD